MKNTLKLNHMERTIVMDKTFAKFAANTMSEEYAHLQRVRQDYPLYTVVQRHIKINPGKECYRGLTYRYMEDYISSHGSADDLHTYNEMKLISECHSKAHRYPVIKSWFLEQFPEIAKFGLKEQEDTDAAEEQKQNMPVVVEVSHAA